jgi:hypothetical protein
MYDSKGPRSVQLKQWRPPRPQRAWLIAKSSILRLEGTLPIGSFSRTTQVHALQPEGTRDRPTRHENMHVYRYDNSISDH